METESRDDEEMTTVICDLHASCNQDCRYCISRSSATHEFGRAVEPWARKRFLESLVGVGPANIVLTGGEPLITPRISEFIAAMIAAGHKVSIQTNLKVGIQAIIANLPPEKTRWLLVSLHSVALGQLELFYRNIGALRFKGYPIVVKVVMDKEMLAVVDDVVRRINEHGVGTVLSPVVQVQSDGFIRSICYDRNSWQRIEKLITLRSSWLYFGDGFRSKGVQCSAGRKMFYVRLSDGVVHGCCHGYPAFIGNIYEGPIVPLEDNVECGMDQCACDFHYYTGVIPQLDDSKAFSQLMLGHWRRVYQKEYEYWLNAAGVNAVSRKGSVIDRWISRLSAWRYNKV